jgi:hypothetical protein
MPLPTRLHTNLLLTGRYMTYCAARNDLSNCHNCTSFSQYRYEIFVPRNIEEALKFDLENGNKFWELKIAKEMKNVCVAFNSLSHQKNLRQVTRRSLFE